MMGLCVEGRDMKAFLWNEDQHLASLLLAVSRATFCPFKPWIADRGPHIGSSFALARPGVAADERSDAAGFPGPQAGWLFTRAHVLLLMKRMVAR